MSRLLPAIDPSDVDALVAALMDGGASIELYAAYEPSVRVFMGRMGGRSVGVIVKILARFVQRVERFKRDALAAQPFRTAAARRVQQDPRAALQQRHGFKRQLVRLVTDADDDNFSHAYRSPVHLYRSIIARGAAWRKGCAGSTGTVPRKGSPSG